MSTIIATYPSIASELDELVLARVGTGRYAVAYRRIGSRARSLALHPVAQTTAKLHYAQARRFGEVFAAFKKR